MVMIAPGARACIAAGLSPGKLLSTVAKEFPAPGCVLWMSCGDAPAWVGPTVAVVAVFPEVLLLFTLNMVATLVSCPETIGEVW
jgi:hypothetical protein